MKHNGIMAVAYMVALTLSTFTAALVHQPEPPPSPLPNPEMPIGYAALWTTDPAIHDLFRSRNVHTTIAVQVNAGSTLSADKILTPGFVELFDERAVRALEGSLVPWADVSVIYADYEPTDRPEEHKVRFATPELVHDYLPSQIPYHPAEGELMREFVDGIQVALDEAELEASIGLWSLSRPGPRAPPWPSEFMAWWTHSNALELYRYAGLEDDHEGVHLLNLYVRGSRPGDALNEYRRCVRSIVWSRSFLQNMPVVPCLQALERGQVVDGTLPVDPSLAWAQGAAIRDTLTERFLVWFQDEDPRQHEAIEIFVEALVAGLRGDPLRSVQD